MKTCTKCKNLKDMAMFSNAKKNIDGKSSWCKSCTNLSSKKCPSRDPKIVREYCQKRYAAKKEHILAVNKNWNKNNPNYKNEYDKKRKLIDPNYRLRKILRCRLNKALKGLQKSGSAIKDLGCSVEFLKSYLEKQFLPGMTWQNHGKWHVDHVMPLSLFNLSNREELLKACHYTNLQPLWALDNFSKGNKI